MIYIEECHFLVEKTYMVLIKFLTRIAWETDLEVSGA